MNRRLKSKPVNVMCDEEFLKELPYFNRKISEIDKVKRRKAIIYKFVRQIPSDNDK